MSTKNNPGEFDCYGDLEPHEEYFLVRSHDDDGHMFVRFWAFWRMMLIQEGRKPRTDQAAVNEAIHCATRMRIQNAEYRATQVAQSMMFDDRGVPLAGDHARKDNVTTSGVGETEVKICPFWEKPCSIPEKCNVEGACYARDEGDTTSTARTSSMGEK